MKKWWTNLKDCHKKYDSRKWSEQAKQSGDGTQFKVGGHDCGHMHVDWEQTDQGWRIAKVWMCRSTEPISRAARQTHHDQI